MNPELPGPIPSAVQSLLADPVYRNRVAQAHSRSVLWRLRADQRSWPNYDRELDDKLHYTAHYLLWHGLQLKTIDDQKAIGDDLIKQGAEILEYLYARAGNTGPDATRQLVNAAIAYYIAGHYARAHVLMKDLSASARLSQEQELLRRLFLKDLNGLRNLVFSILLDDAYSDSAITASLESGEVSEDEAISRILHATLNRAFSFFLEHPKTGIQALLDRAINLVDQGIVLALKTRFVDWWWLFTCARYLFREYGDNALWTQLAPLQGDDPTGRFVLPYIHANYRRRIPVIELWRSQVVALPAVNEPERRSYCLKMPTSAGKTRVAEMAMLRFLIDYAEDPNAKCIYIAPFRSLAVEIEHSLQESFHPLGVRVSEIYGGFELSPIERLLMDHTRVVIATPEKIDAFLRYNPEFAQHVKLVIIDEGHIISLTDRGLRYEMFLHRLVRRFSLTGVRFLFVSAVLPNTEEFAQWITGDGKNVIQSPWRPSRQILGELRWDGQKARIEYIEADHEKLGHECFVPSFISPVDPRALRGIHRRIRFPNEISEVVADAAVRFAQQGMTMVFCARRRSVMSLAREVMTAIKIHQAVAIEQGQSFALPINEQERPKLDECIRLAGETMGADHEIIGFLRAGVVIHHAGIPKPLRIRLEEIVRARVVQLVIASTTLAQGVNLPIQTVLVFGLSHGYDQELTPTNFWNICGRAGRGMVENEGQVLFAVDLDQPDVTLSKETQRGLSSREIARRTEYKRKMKIDEERELRVRIIEGYRTYQLKSALRGLLERITDEWRTSHESVDVAELCQRLAENDMSWALDKQRPAIERLLAWLDTELLALIEEAEPVEITPDLLQQLMHNSLAVLQAGKLEQADEQIAYIRDALFARIQYVYSRARTSSQRKRFYQIGLPLADCEQIERRQEELLNLIMQADQYELWDVEARCKYLSTITDFLLTLSELQPSNNSVIACWPQMLRLWLVGTSPNEMVLDPEIAICTKSPAEISSFIDDVFTYRLPWGLNALGVYLNQLAVERGLILPLVTSYFSAMIRYGVHSPVASCLLAFGVSPRKLALLLSAEYPHQLKDVSDVLVWFLTLTADNLKEMGFDDDQIQNVRHFQLQAGRLQKTSSTYLRQQGIFDIVIPRVDGVDTVQPGDLLIMRSSPDKPLGEFSIHTLWGTTLGTLWLSPPFPDAWLRTEKVQVYANKIDKLDDDRVRLQVVVQEV